MWLRSIRNNKGSVNFDPKRLPLNPRSQYKDKGWTNWDKAIKGTIYPFDEFKKIIQENKNDILKFEGRGLNGQYLEWFKSVRNDKGSVTFDPNRLPSNPRFKYKEEGWLGWKKIIPSSNFILLMSLKKLFKSIEVIF